MNIKDIHIPFTSRFGAANQASLPKITSLGTITPDMNVNAGATFDSSKPATPFHAEPVPIAIPLSPDQVVTAQAQELKEHAATGQKMTYTPLPEAVAAAKVVVEGSVVSNAPAPIPAPAPIIPEIVPEPKPAAVAVAQPKELTVATAPVVPVHHDNGFVSFFKHLGSILSKAIPFADAIQHAPAVQALESMAFGPGVANLITVWADKALTVQAATVAAVGDAEAATDKNNLQKASIVINSMLPTAQALAAQLGAAPLTIADMKTVNDAIITIANIFKIPTSTTPTA